jgi:hypothetical protein
MRAQAFHTQGRAQGITPEEVLRKVLCQPRRVSPGAADAEGRMSAPSAKQRGHVQAAFVESVTALLRHALTERFRFRLTVDGKKSDGLAELLDDDGVVMMSHRLAGVQLALPVLGAELARRVTYPEAIGAGLGPTTLAPSSEAAREVRRLATELERLGGLSGPKGGA